MRAPASQLASAELLGVVEGLRDYCATSEKVARRYYPASKISNA